MVLTDYVDFLPPMHVTACCGAIVLVLFGVLSQKEAFASFEMLTVFMLAFMMPLGTALNDTGAGKMIADAVISVTGQSSPMIIMASLWILTWALTQVMSNTAACTCCVRSHGPLPNHWELIREPLSLQCSLQVVLQYVRRWQFRPIP